MNPFSDASAASRLSQGDKSVWVTNLSAGEFLLAKKAGLRPLGQVMGTSVFSPGGASFSSAVSGELKFLTGAYRDAQARSIARLRAEAKQLNASGVVGVETRLSAFGSDGLLEFSLIGTAVKTNLPDSGKEPFLCSVPGDEYYLYGRPGGVPSVWHWAAARISPCPGTWGLPPGRLARRLIRLSERNTHKR